MLNRIIRKDWIHFNQTCWIRAFAIRARICWKSTSLQLARGKSVISAPNVGCNSLRLKKVGWGLVSSCIVPGMTIPGVFFFKQTVFPTGLFE